MSTEQHDAYGKELSRISRHQSDAVTARITVFEALTLAGVSPAQRNPSSPSRPRRANGPLRTM
ncbi:hypothetical protein [Streptomyces violaceusniger]|uniref:Uncharacterized protein n=1 Tax=Streptomyces violaceusniger (strain Tu 4113) TaxID=653045 RepID=G2PHC7_STRV4|nr:hypothetical protein [Streptomyces violaceusniger]AEM88773.1 hypothetical protein Strvi_9526 [Streptomyces violaceusniger Tu 4113]